MVVRSMLTALALSTAFAGGCSLPTDHAVKINVSPTAARIDRSYAVDIENRGGEVRVVVEPGLTSPIIEAVVTDQGGGFLRRTPDPTVKGWYAADVTVRDGRPLLRVLTKRSDDTQPATYVGLTVRVPSCDGLRVRNTGGPVVAKGVWGEIRIENGFGGGVGGDVRVSTTRRLTDPIELSSTGGDVTLLMPRDSTGRFEITNPEGHIDFAARTDQLSGVRRTSTVHRAVVNNGQNEVRLSTARGTVRVEVGEGIRHAVGDY
ncbi:MAG: hypothetical protein HRU70_09770 [Phycisphaeraceae bacterium]|nr:MAG: hypothetical protein HRU70_09770 [Phycisphaeraceae bacterium]